MLKCHINSGSHTSVCQMFYVSYNLHIKSGDRYSSLPDEETGFERGVVGHVAGLGQSQDRKPGQPTLSPASLRTASTDKWPLCGIAHCTATWLPEPQAESRAGS